MSFSYFLIEYLSIYLLLYDTIIYIYFGMHLWRSQVDKHLAPLAERRLYGNLHIREREVLLL
jgi:hypothetical protein